MSAGTMPRGRFVTLMVLAVAMTTFVFYWKLTHGRLPVVEFGTKVAVFDPNDNVLILAPQSAAPLRLDLAFAVEETVRLGEFGKAVQGEGENSSVHVRLLGEGDPREVDLQVRKLESGAVALSLTGDPLVQLSLSGVVEPRSVFAEESGELDTYGATLSKVILCNALQPFALVGKVPLHGSLVASNTDQRARLTITGKEMSILLGQGEPSAALWKRIFSLKKESTETVRGTVSGQHVRALVTGLDEEGRPRIRFAAEKNGTFEVAVPKSVTRWFAAEGPTERSPPIHFPPGTSWPLTLDIAPGGDLTVNVVDVDTGAPLTARVFVHGVEGTLDPSFGPDYKASGAGPLIDALRGFAKTPLPRGKYVVSATKGMEYTIDRDSISIESGKERVLSLALRHVIRTPDLVGCDLHVHARPSFDSPVTVEDRVLSLVSAGVDFAVPTEHNAVGDYSSALSTLELTGSLSSVTGVEVTTGQPQFGHFGVFPYPHEAGVPPHKGTTPAALFAAVRNDPHRVLQVNHPRLSHEIGYFDVFGFDPKVSKGTPGKMRLDFDTLEVYNGYEAAHRERVDVVLHDFFALLNRGRRYAATGSSDSHRIQYQWAGYPRTYARFDHAATGDEPQRDPNAVVERIKSGHSFVTSGPIVEFTIGRAHPGDEAVIPKGEVHAHLRVRAAPWVDVTGVEIVAGGQSVFTKAVGSRPSVVGRPTAPKSSDEVDAVRFDEEVLFKVPDGATWVLAIVRGERLLEDVLAFMPIAPFSFTNPIWLKSP